MTKVLYPGTFDPFTNGHLDIVTQATTLFDSVVIGLGTNTSKTPMFDGAHRLDMARAATAHLPSVEVVAYEGLTCELAKAVAADALIRGVRSGADLDFEMPIARANLGLGQIPTLYLCASPQHQWISSTIVREVAKLGGDFRAWVPEAVARAMEDRR